MGEKMNKTMKLIGTGFIGVVCFIYVTFSIIHMTRVNSKMDEWNESYKAIEEDVSAFIKVSDPKTIRLYVKELNKILDEIHFLGKMINSGQLADESLTSILDEQVLINKRLKYVATHTDSVFKRYNAWIETNSDYVNYNESDIDTLGMRLDSTKVANSLLSKQIEDIQIDIDKIEKMIDDIKDSKINKFW